MNAVIYAWYSSDCQREESIEGQFRECAAFAVKNDMVGIEHYIDRAFSAAYTLDFQRKTCISPENVRFLLKTLSDCIIIR